jgi:hypothetical protein
MKRRMKPGMAVADKSSNGGSTVYSLRPADETNGNWGTQHISALRIGHCDIEQIDAANMSLPGLMTYAARGAPVLIKGAFASNAAIMEWPKDEFVNKYGDERVSIGTTPHSRRIGVTGLDMTVAEYIEAYMSSEVVLDAVNQTLPSDPIPYIHDDEFDTEELLRPDFADPPFFDKVYQSADDGHTETVRRPSVCSNIIESTV